MNTVVLLLMFVVAVIAVRAAWLSRRVPQPQADPRLDLMQKELSLLRESTERSIQSMGSGFTSQMQSVQTNVQSTLTNVSQTVNGRLEEMNRQMHDQLQSNVRLVSSTSDSVTQRISAVQSTFAGLQKQVGEMSEQARHLAEMSKSISTLERVLSAPKLRGGFGEAQLENLLKMVFAHDQYQMEFPFSSGEKADAVLFFPQGHVAIDSKFPLENFRRMTEAESDSDKKASRREFLRDVKRRIDEIAVKYIRPADGTLPFALMYIPAENVYYETIIRDDEGNDLYNYCLQRRVLPVSPNSLYAYLQTIVLGLNSMRVSERAEWILREIEGLRIEMGKFSECFEVAGKHLRNAQGKYEESARALDKIQNRVEGLGNSAGDAQSALFEPETRPALKASAN
ncbi:MAG TPA: DNA recombination protein RmuC [Terriglobales bacterium]|nr:DNA recombination protein RmuC [Terriglobales bacterium]